MNSLHRSLVRTARVAVTATSLCLMAGIVLAAPPASAITVSRTYYVGTTADNNTYHSPATCENAHNTVCSLRLAVELAYDDGSGITDTIKFATPKGSTITLNPSDPYIELNGDEALTIDGQGAGDTFISGGHRVQVFESDMETLTIENLTIENGLTSSGGGAGIANIYDLTLTNVNFTGNQETVNNEGGGAVYSSDELKINGGTYTDNVSEDCGGAIYDDYQATVSHAQFIDNASDCGGAIDAQESTNLSVSGSYFAGNVSRNYDDGGAIETEGDTTILNNTFVDNVADEYGGAIAFESDASGVVGNNTMVDNWALQGGGGLANDNGELDVSGNILLGNTEAAGAPGSGILAQCVDYGGSFNDVGGNVLGPDVDAACPFSSPTDRLNANPHLGPVANNGGATPTMAITDTSVAAYLVPWGVCPATDQRGQPRGGNCSAGAYQVEPTGSATTCHSLSGSVTSTITFSGCTNKGSANTSVGGSGMVLINGGKLTWHPSHLQSTISVTESDLGSNPCGGGNTTLKVFGIVTASTSPGAPFFDRVSAEVCVAAGTEDVSLYHGTTAKF